mgnify:CR=1 FL=1
MHIAHLSLTNLRNYTRLELDLQPRIHIFQGENAQGKTNLLEAIYYLATTKSPLASSDRQLIHWAAGEVDPVSQVIPYAHAGVRFVRAGEEHTLEATLVLEPAGEGEAKTLSLRRQLLLDGVPRRALDIVGALNAVLFLPQDVTLVAGPPVERRRYLDVTLCQVDAVYCRTLSRYNRVITQRNALLRRLRERQAGIAELDYWDEQLAKLGAYVLAKRCWVVGELGREAARIQAALTGGGEHLELGYRNTAIERSGEGDALLAEAEHERRFRQALRAARGEEIARGMTVIGPHRDDVHFLLNGIDATIFGSRGQQRTIALALKLAEVSLIEEQTSEKPVLLLDDVISELDQQRCELLFEAIARVDQVLITTTHLTHYAADLLSSAILWRIAAGAIIPLAHHRP